METKKVQQYKVNRVKQLKDEISEVRDILMADYRGLNVEQITELRNQLREKDATFKVVKNNLAKIALKELDIAGAEDYFVGPTAVALIKSDSGPVAKVLLDFAKNAPLAVKGGVVAGQTYDAKQIEALSKLPGKEQLIAMLMSTMNAPLQNMVYVLNGVTTKLVRTLVAVQEKKESE